MKKELFIKEFEKRFGVSYDAVATFLEANEGKSFTKESFQIATGVQYDLYAEFVSKFVEQPEIIQPPGGVLPFIRVHRKEILADNIVEEVDIEYSNVTLIGGLEAMEKLFRMCSSTKEKKPKEEGNKYIGW